MYKLIDTRGLDLEDIKEVLIANDEVVSSRDYGALLSDYCKLLAICYKADKDSPEAKEYLQKGVISRFEDFIPDNHKEEVIRRANDFLGIKEDVSLSQVGLIEEYRLQFNHLLALNILSSAGYEKAINYINDNAANNFESNISDSERKDFLLEAINKLDEIYPG